MEQGEWLQGGGWRAWVVNNARASRPNEARNEIDRLRAELRGDFRSALRHAYLGPRSAVRALLASSAAPQHCFPLDCTCSCMKSCMQEDLSHTTHSIHNVPAADLQAGCGPE